ncbi:hypothetical protein N8I77_012361 [Diaporthe amygdali]|uniref:Cytochrome P450 n=1 Tax=Phomopsis amygdali TaxID=1214568 RepID=A0AAD9VYT9_PHOAM|nr:hypothetical protein N8I77_012361 [Diaporthe amygdali]
MSSTIRAGLPPSSLIWAFVVFGLAYGVWTVIYAYTLHPLAKFPGPWWAAISRIPYWIIAVRGEQIHFMRRLHEKYGPVIRFSPNELSYTDPQAWKDICGYDRGKPENLKAPEAHLPPHNGTPHLITAKTADHRRVRRLFSPAFSDRSLRQQEPLFRKYVDLLISKLRETDGQPVQLGEMLNFATFDIMGDLTFGQPLGLLESAEYSSWVKNVFDAVRVLPLIQVIEYYPLLSKIYAFLEPKKVNEMKTTHFKHSADRVDRRLEQKSDQPDIWNLVLSAKDEKSLTLNEMHSNAELFMLAGTDTTATLLMGLFYLLLNDSARMKRVVTEVRDQQKARGVLDFESLAGLSYLNACIQETFRIYPPVPVGIPRVIPADNGGRMICDRWVGPGTRVSIHQYATYHSAANFKDPDAFVPERWLGATEYMDDKRDALQPFSYGPRNCIGQNMAWHELRLIIGLLVANFDLELCEESRSWMDQKVHVLWEKKPLMVKLKPVGQEIVIDGL